MAGDPYLIDSNVLIRWVQTGDPGFPAADATFDRLTLREANRCAVSVESRLRLLPDIPAVHTEWRRLLVDYRVSGVQVHDARLVAAMRVHGVRFILTFNAKDFARFDGIEAVHPQQMD